MYISKLGYPVPEFADINKTFIIEPVLPTNDDDTLVALLPLSHGSVVLAITDAEDIQYTYKYADEEELHRTDIDWVIVDTDEMDHLVSKHLLKYLKQYMDAAINNKI